MSTDLNVAALKDYVSKLEIPKDEKGLLKLFLGASVFFHFIILVVGVDSFISSNRKPIDSEWEIEADLAVGIKGTGKFDSIDRAIKGEEIKVQKQILPQLTKSFEIEEKKVEKVADLGETFVDPELQKKEQKKKAAAKLKKKEALRRLLKERARKEKKFAEKTTSPVAKRLEARKRELEGKNFSLGSEKKLNKFLKQVQISIQRYYSLPEVYRFNDKKLKTLVAVKLDNRGQINDIKVQSSSGNANFDSIAIDTVKKAAPLPAPPKEVVGKPVVVTFNPG